MVNRQHRRRCANANAVQIEIAGDARDGDLALFLEPALNGSHAFLQLALERLVRHVMRTRGPQQRGQARQQLRTEDREDFTV